MNKQNFKNGNLSYPISTDTLDFMQDCTNLTASLAMLAGDNYILKQSSSMSDGIIVIDGEIMPLRGNALDYIEVIEESEDITAFDIIYPKARIRRYAAYKSVSLSGIASETILLLDGARLLQLKEIVNSLSNSFSQSINQLSASLTQVSDSLNNLSNRFQEYYTEFSAHRILLAGNIYKIIAQQEDRIIFDIDFPQAITETYLIFTSIRTNRDNVTTELYTCRCVAKSNDKITLQLSRSRAIVGQGIYIDYHY